MQKTVECFLECYTKMLHHAQAIVDFMVEKGLSIPKGALAYLMSFTDTVDQSVRIEWHNPEGEEYGVVVLPIPEFYKNPENIDVSAVIEQ